jgi:hypothetical protein
VEVGNLWSWCRLIQCRFSSLQALPRLVLSYKQMERLIASCLRKVWDIKYWLFKGQHGFRPGYACESQVITVCLDIADLLDNGARLDAIMIDFSKAFDLIPHDRLLTKIAASGVDWRIFVWMGVFFLCRTQGVRLGGQLSEEVRVTLGVPHGSVILRSNFK